MRAEDLLLRIWRDRNVAARALLPLAALYGAAWHARSAMFRRGWIRSETMPVPVIVVGNVVAGGAGKTPVVIELVRQLRTRGLQPAVISRGHARSSAEVLQVKSDTDARDGGDEPVLIARRTQVPVFVGRNRALAARALLRAYPQTQVIVSDDGLQHLRLARQLEICLFDERGTGNGFLLPAGPLREPWPRRPQGPDAPRQWTMVSAMAPGHPADRACDSVTNADTPMLRIHRRLAAHAMQADGTCRSLDDFSALPCMAVAAIAHPERFFTMLRIQGVRLQDTLALPDHDPFDALPATVRMAPVLLCTEKDAAKLWRSRPDAWAVALQVDLPEGFVDEVVQALGDR